MQGVSVTLLHLLRFRRKSEHYNGILTPLKVSGIPDRIPGQQLDAGTP